MKALVHFGLFLMMTVLVAGAGEAQVINSIGDENMKVPNGMKPQEKKAESPYIADLCYYLCFVIEETVKS